MSRIANYPIDLPKGVEATIANGQVSVKGGNGTLAMPLHESVEVVNDGNQLKFAPRGSEKQAEALAGTSRSIVNNMVTGLCQGFGGKHELVGVGYRAKAQGKTLNLTLGFSHPVDYLLTESIMAETPTQTEIVLKG